VYLACIPILVGEATVMPEVLLPVVDTDHVSVYGTPGCHDGRRVNRTVWFFSEIGPTCQP
jgi:hypothetical protein